jgi:chromosome transmission fidelity protein 4
LTPLTLVGEQGIIYGAPSEDDRPSTIYYKPYDSWASQSEWTIPLPKGEDVVLVAAAGGGGDALGTVVAVTSKGYVRFLSNSGIQRYIWRLGEDGVGIAGGKDSVIIVHREGGTSLDGEFRKIPLLL